MLARWNDSSVADTAGSFAALYDVRRQMDRLFEDWERGWSLEPNRWQLGRVAAPAMHLYDMGDELLLRADLPGFSDNDVQLTLEQGTLTLEGRRQCLAPDGYSVHHQERGSLEFARSFTLPCPVDPDKAQASLKHGCLELRLPKAKEAQPRRIEVKSK